MVYFVFYIILFLGVVPYTLPKDMSFSAQLLYLVIVFIIIPLRIGFFGKTKQKLRKDDVEIGVYNRFLWHTAKFSTPERPDITVWSFLPIKFVFPDK